MLQELILIRGWCQSLQVVPEDPVLAAARNAALCQSKSSLRHFRNEMHGLKQDVSTAFTSLTGTSMQSVMSLRELTMLTRSRLAADFNDFSSQFLSALASMNASATQANERYLKELKERRRLHNVVAELKGNIRVFCRIRPASRDELSTGDKIGITTVVRAEL